MEDRARAYAIARVVRRAMRRAARARPSARGREEARARALLRMARPVLEGWAAEELARHLHPQSTTLAILERLIERMNGRPDPTWASVMAARWADRLGGEVDRWRALLAADGPITEAEARVVAAGGDDAARLAAVLAEPLALDGRWTLRFAGLFHDPRWETGARWWARGPAGDRELVMGEIGRISGPVDLDDAALTWQDGRLTAEGAGGVLTVTGVLDLLPPCRRPRRSRAPTALADDVAIVAARAVRQWAAIGRESGTSGYARRAWAAWEALRGWIGADLDLALPERPRARVEAWCWQLAGEVVAVAAHRDALWILDEDEPLTAASEPLSIGGTVLGGPDEVMAEIAAAGALSALAVDPRGGVLRHLPPDAPLDAARALLEREASAVARVAAALQAWREMTVGEALAVATGDVRTWSLGRLAAAIEAARGPLDALRAARTWDYDLEPADGVELAIEGRHNGYGIDVVIHATDVQEADLPNSWSHPEFRAAPSADGLLDLRIDVDAGARGAGVARLRCGALTTDAMRVGEPAPPRDTAGPGLRAALLGWAPSLATTRPPAVPRPVDLDPAGLPASIARRVNGLRLAGPHASTAAADAAIRAAAARGGQAVDVPPAARQEALALATRAVVGVALGLPWATLRLDPDASPGARAVFDPTAFGPGDEAARTAHLAGMAADVHRSLGPWLPDPADRERLARGEALASAHADRIARLAEVLAARGALSADEARAAADG